MNWTWVIIWSLVAVFTIGYISYLLYQLFYRLKNLSVESLKLQQAASDATRKAEMDSEGFVAAVSTNPNTLFELLGQRRKRKRQIERKKLDRRRRLISRISMIEINERFK